MFGLTRILARKVASRRAQNANYNVRRDVSLSFSQGTAHALDDDVESGDDRRPERPGMPTLEERVADLEARMKPDLREEMIRGFERMDGQFARMADQFARMEGRFEHFESRLERLEDRFDRIEDRFERMENRFERLEDKVDRHFVWIVGMQLTMMMTMIGVLAAAYFRLA
jgi:chromosome segregation ATPase